MLDYPQTVLPITSGASAKPQPSAGCSALTSRPGASRNPTLPSFHPHLHNAPLVHGTQDEQGVRGPLDVLDLVQAGVELQDLQGARIPNHQTVLYA